MKIFLHFWEALLLLLLVILPSTKAVAVCDDNQTLCGNISIPYPFGLSPDCARSKDFVLSCNQTSNPPKLSFNSILTEGNKSYNNDIEVSNITLEQGLLHAKIPLHVFDFSGWSDNVTSLYWIYLLHLGGPYTISQTYNMFTVVGCSSAGLTDEDSNYLAMCRPTCTSVKLINGSCNGIGCCQTFIPLGLRSYGLKAKRPESTSSVSNVTHVFLVEKDKYTFNSLDLDPNSGHLNRMSPLVLEWGFDNTTCNIAAKNLTSFACVSKNSICHNTTEPGPGYICNCSSGYQGNPYISNGCQDVDECQIKDVCRSGQYCINMQGTFRCETKGGSHNQVVLAGVLGGGFGFLVLLALLALLHRKWKARNLEKTKRRNYQCNHGMLLEKLISLDEGGTVSDQGFMVFPLTEIEKATNNFDATRILGNGGHATVYKGLLSDKRVVAIKKSKLINPQEIKEFINEVFILSRIRHRNVVKLLGCCLETEVPLLVYEFIPNGTLAEHLHICQRPSSLSWDDRLRIASETASALSHLHCDASISVFHRDVKSSNILLDSNFTAKVSDFGASRSIPLHESATAGLSTVVQGTFGYLDPEYYHTGQLTQKSDVYSFGVILAELLTGEKPISQSRTEVQANLGTYFVSATKENRIFEIVEPHIVNNNTRKDIEAVAFLAETCLKMQGVERPTMKEVELALMSLKWSKKQHQHQHQHPWNSSENNEEITQLFHQDYPRSSSGFNGHYDSTGKYSLEMLLQPSLLMEYAR